MSKLLSLSLLSFSLLLFLAQPARADFTAPAIIISNSPAAGSMLPKVVWVPGTSALLVVWIEVVGTDDYAYFSRSTDGGATWTTPLPFSPQGQIRDPYDGLYGNCYAYSMLANDSSVHVVTQWRQNDADDFEILLLSTSDLGDTWYGEQLTNNSTPSRYPDLAAFGGYLHVTYQDSWPGNDEIMYKRVTDYGFGPVDLTRRLTFSSSASYFPRIAVGTDEGCVNIVYQDSQSGAYNIYHKLIYNEGSGAYETHQLTFGSSPNWNGLPDIITSTGTAADDQYIYVVYQGNWPGNLEVFYKRLDHCGISPFSVYTARLTYSPTDSYSNEVAFDSANNTIHVTFEDNWPGNYDIFHRKLADYGGAGFTGQRVSWGTGDSFAPSIAVDGTNVYIVWTDNTPGNYEVFFKKGS